MEKVAERRHFPYRTHRGERDWTVYPSSTSPRSTAPTVAPGTTLTANILVIEPDQKILLAREHFRVEPQGIDARRRALAKELRVDLSAWAGRRVRLLLRTTRRGRVHMRPLERQGFGTVWEDPKLVQAASESGR